jgi:hypothetical protein
MISQKAPHACQEQASASGPKSDSPQAAQTSELLFDFVEWPVGSDLMGEMSIL